jgi:hypothetical protein
MLPVDELNAAVHSRLSGIANAACDGSTEHPQGVAERPGRAGLNLSANRVV